MSIRTVTVEAGNQITVRYGGPKGDVGPTGLTGPSGIPIGSVNWRGEWSAAVIYAAGDGCTLNDCAYISLQNGNLNHQPPNISYWVIVSGPGTLTLAQIATPSAPASGYTKLFAKSDGKIYRLAYGGVETALRPVSVFASYNTNASQSVVHNTLTIVDFEDMVADTHSAVIVGASWKFVAPVSGYYIVTANIEFNNIALDSTEYIAVYLYKNDVSQSLRVLRAQVGGCASSYWGCAHNDIIYLAAGDYIDIRVKQISGASANLSGATANYVRIFALV